MKRFLLVSLIIIETLAAAQNTKPFYIPVYERNYAQNLGGYSEEDYSFTKPSLNFERKKGKKLIKQYTYTSYDEAIENMPTFPDVTEIDTIEELTDFLNIVRACDWAVTLHEPREDVKAAKKRLADAMMENAKRAAKGLPYDTELHFDPKAKQYDALIKKMNVYYVPEAKAEVNMISPFSTSDNGYKDYLFSFPYVGYNKKTFNEFAPLRKKICHEWFASSTCQQIEELDAQPVKDRAAEKELVEAYNQKTLKRWIELIEPHLQKDLSTLKKLIPYLRELETIRGEDEITSEYVNAYNLANSYVEFFFRRCYNWLEFIGSAPMIKTPASR